MPDFILDFCADCGAVLRAGLGLEDVPVCDNCGSNVKDRAARIQGEFSEDEAQRLFATSD